MKRARCSVYMIAIFDISIYGIIVVHEDTGIVRNIDVQFCVVSQVIDLFLMKAPMTSSGGEPSLEQARYVSSNHQHRLHAPR